MQENPYIYNGPLNPVKDKLILVPRTDNLDKIIDGIKKGEYWAILGIRQIGKTTMLRQIKNKIKNAHHIYINFDVSPTESKQNFYQWLMTEFLEQISSQNGHQLIEKWKNFAPDIQFIHFLENFTPKTHKKKIILLFDEIEGISMRFLTSLLLILRKIYQDGYHKKVFNRYAVVIAGAQNLATTTMEGANTPFDIAKTLYIRDFSPQESMELIEKPFRQIKINIEQKAKEKLVSQVSGHPQLLQHTCYNLVNIGIKHKREINEADVDEAIGILLKENVTIDTLREDVKGNEKLERLTRKIFAGKKEEYHLYKQFSIIGAGSIVEDKDSHCAIRNKVYEKFLLDYLKIPLGDRIAYSSEKFEFIEKDSTTRFEVIHEIGKGGRGVVYKAEDKKLDRMVAIKQLNENAENKDKFDELIEEARTTAKLDHENIVKVYDIKKIKNSHIIIMEFVEGEDYDKIIQREGYLTIEETFRVAKALFETLKYSHANKIIHKDIKLKNIMKDQNGKIKIVDFGIASIGAGTDKQNPQYIMGSPCCISPEQITMEVVDHRSDIYSAGAALFHLVTGRTPFRGRSLGEIFHKHLEEPIPSINELRPEVPIQLVHLIEKCMRKKKEQRYQSAEEALKDIETCMKNQKINSTQNAKVMPAEIKKIEKRQTYIELNKNEIISNGDKTLYNPAGSTSKIEKHVNQNRGNSNKKTTSLKKNPSKSKKAG